MISAALSRCHRDFPDCEVVVVDGGSTDGTPELVGPPARLVRGPRSRGRQLNAGIIGTLVLPSLAATLGAGVSYLLVITFWLVGAAATRWWCQR